MHVTLGFQSDTFVTFLNLFIYSFIIFNVRSEVRIRTKYRDKNAQTVGILCVLFSIGV